jgi:endogenous inhibitor of DNA gyrase (YacG/DUF329 family)
VDHHFNMLTQACRVCGRSRKEIEDFLPYCSEATEEAKKRQRAERSWRDTIRALGFKR